MATFRGKEQIEGATTAEKKKKQKKRKPKSKSGSTAAGPSEERSLAKFVPAQRTRRVRVLAGM